MFDVDPTENSIDTEYNEEYTDSDDDNIETLLHDLDAPKCATTGQTYCEQVDEYPAQHINDLMNISSIRQMLQNDIAADQPVELTSRIGKSSIDDELAVCRSRMAIIYPRMALTVDNHWSYIINQELHTQGVHVMLCMPDEHCDLGQFLVNGYVSMCKQRYDKRLLLSIDRNGQPRQTYFHMPSHCECVLKYSGQF